MLEKIISGGQTGADYGALLAARELKIPTGGYMPKNFLTELGPRPDIAITFNLQEHSLSNYPPRTENNVLLADGVILFGILSSHGTVLTERYAKKYQKPIFRVEWTTGQRILVYENFRPWLFRNKIKTLNVAGNRESINPGITEMTKQWLLLNLFKRK